MSDYLKQLAIKNKHTLPEISCNEVFLKSEVDITPIRIRAMKDMDFLKGLPVMSVNIANVFPTQNLLYLTNLEATREIGNETGAYLLFMQGKYYIFDGHHRIANRILQGHSTVSGYVIRKYTARYLSIL